MIDLHRLEVKKQFAVLSHNEGDKFPHLDSFLTLFSKMLLKLTAGEHDTTVSVEEVHHNFTLYSFNLPAHNLRQQAFICFRRNRAFGLEMHREVMVVFHL